MQNQNQNNKRNYKIIVLKVIWIMYAMFSVVIWLPKADGLLCTNYEQASEHVALSSSWNIRIHNEEYRNVSLGELNFPAVNKGDCVIMECTLPQQLPYREGALRIKNKHSAVRLFIDGEVIYEYGFERAEKNKSVGSGAQFINFPDTYQGKKMRIELYVDEDNAFTYIDEINIYKWESALQALLTENRIPMFLGGFLLVFGLVALVITIFVVLLSPKYFRIILLAAFSICMGIWTLCYYDIMTAFTIPLYSISFMEHMALYLAPIPIIGYMYDLIKRLESRSWKISYWIVFSIQLLFVLVTITLHTFDIVHCAASLPLLLILIVMELVYFFVVLALNFKKSIKSKNQIKLYLAGILILVTGIGYDIISYSSSRYLGCGIPLIKGVSSLAIILFVVGLIYIFFMDITEKMMKEKERDLLIQSAYSDELTKLHNRRYCSEYMKEAEEKGIENYAILCFDVNNLKTVNDTYGHAKGDILIKDSANLIKETFQDYGVVGRMGGDEFIAIINIKSKDEMIHLIEMFKQNIRKNNHSTKDFPVSIAIGYALGIDENAENTEKLYQIADNRMYQNKTEMKKKLRNHPATI